MTLTNIINMVVSSLLLTLLITYCTVVFVVYKEFSFTKLIPAVCGALLLADRLLALFNVKWFEYILALFK